MKIELEKDEVLAICGLVRKSTENTMDPMLMRLNKKLSCIEQAIKNTDGMKFIS